MDDSIINDPKINQWFKVIRASDATRDIYADYIKKYCKIAEKTPSELIAESIAEYKAGKMPSERSDFEHIAAFLDVLEREDYAPKSVALMLSIVRSFYKAFDIQISESIGKNQDNEVLEGNVNFLSREDVIKMITHARTLRDRAIILCMVSSGMARNNIINLKMSDIEFENGMGVIGRKRRSKSRADFITFLSPEACKALQDYFSERNLDGGTKVKGDDDYVFVTYKTNSSKPGQQITKFSFIKTFERLAEDLGLTNGAAGGFILSRSHALRKFFATSMQKSGMPKHYIDFMMGHKLKELDFAYFHNDLETMKKLYIEHVKSVSFDKVPEILSLSSKDREKLVALEKENKQMKSTIDDLSLQNKTFQVAFENEKLKGGNEKVLANEVQDLKIALDSYKNDFENAKSDLQEHYEFKERELIFRATLFTKMQQKLMPNLTEAEIDKMMQEAGKELKKEMDENEKKD